MNCANHPDRERTAFCQNCGKPLCQECTRVVGSAVFCEPCLAAKLAGTPPPSGGGSYTYTGGEGGVNYTVSGAIPPPPLPGEPNPGLAALLGFIPGVGAMYNGQYAKGVVHLIVFAILVSLANENGIFLLFIAGWVCYQVIEAHQTARARRDGTPLPNPFGLNDLGERLGFGKAWPGTPNHHAATAAQPTSSTETSTPPAAGAYTPPPPGYASQATASWSAPWENYNYHYPPPATPIPPYGTPGYPVDPNLVPASRNRFPGGALWLIGLGCLFLIGNSGLFRTFPIHRLFPLFLIGFGVWIFVRRMTDTGTGLADDGTPGYQFRLFRALRGSVWIVLVGVLFFLDGWGILSWGRSWPVFIIVAGLMAIFQRVSYHSSAATPYPYPAPPVAPPYPSPDPGTPIVPPTQHDQEGR
jgi:B-box zinc finger